MNVLKDRATWSLVLVLPVTSFIAKSGSVGDAPTAVKYERIYWY